MKKQSLLLFFVGITQLLYLYRWHVCNSLTDNFHFAYSNFLMHLDIAIHNDKYVPIWIVRIFHNKVVMLIKDVSDAYLQYGDILFLTNLVSLVGVFGIAAAIWFVFIGKKRNVFLPLLGIVCVMPFIEIFLYQQIPFVLRLLLFALPLFVLGILGIKELLKTYKHAYVIWLLLIISVVWYVVFFNELGFFCIQNN